MIIDRDDWIRVPSGGFLYGPKQVRRCLREYHIGKYPVTYSEYNEYVQETGRPWNGKSEEANYDDPAMRVTWSGAYWYCKWLNGKTGGKYGFVLPTVEHWEKAVSMVVSYGLWEWTLNMERGKHILRRYRHGTVRQREEESKRDYSDFGFRLVASIPDLVIEQWHGYVCGYCGSRYDEIPAICGNCQSEVFERV